MNQDLKHLLADVREQVAFLKELGVDGLDAGLPETISAPVSGATQVSVPRAPTVREPPPHDLNTTPISPKKTNAGARLAALPSLAKREPTTPMQKADATKTAQPGTQAPKTEKVLFEVSGGLPVSTESMEDVWADIGNCTRCPLHQGRTQIVHTVGNYDADLMFVGEAPGADEDAKGEPFVGRAGQLLNKIIEAIGMKREEVCIGNINRCRPPGNRQPTLPEAHTCRPFLMREIAIIRPKVIVVMGNTALHNLLDTKIGISRMRGQFHDYFGVKVMPTFHPAYLLRDPSKKREVWDDMKMVKAYLTSLTG
ncbi:MAG TPA: uracil-DNA glycosylase [Pyrinomonadaceae bacterium]|nr:uracil-DNA glycosylase [Pyrinomonadaceae bacterium]